MNEETIDDIIQRFTMECLEEQKRLNSTSESGTEPFTGLLQKYQRNQHDEER